MKIFFAGTHSGSNTSVLAGYFCQQGHDVVVRPDQANTESFDIAFTNNGRLLERVKAKLKVNTQHGNLFLGDTKPEPQYGIQLALAASESEKEMMVRNGFYPENVIVTGQPRIDLLFQHHKKIELAQNFLTSKGLNPDIPTVLYAPTYSRGAFGMGEKLFLASSINNIDDADGVNSLVGTCEEMGYNLIIRLHKYQKRFFGGKLVPDYLTDVLANVEVHDNEMEPDSLPVLLAADILITDFSSITADFLALDKPIIFVEPHSGWTYTKQWHVQKYERSKMGIIAENSKDLVKCMRTSIDTLEVFNRGDRQEAARKYQPYFDGECCRRVYEAVMERYG